MNIDQLKKKVRKEIKEARRQLSEEDRISRSRSIFEEIEALNSFKQASSVMVYWSMIDEVYTHDFIQRWYEEKIILLPVIKKDELIVRRFAGIQQLEKERTLGIMEPLGEEYDIVSGLDLAIVPGVAFDPNGNRLGRGRAFYDKFLSGLEVYKIGVCFDFQIVNQLPYTSLDIKMDKIVSG